MKRFAVIDLGTNTFHLLIAGRKSESEFIEIYRERIYVKLGQDGLTTLSSAAFKRAYEAMKKFRHIIDLFEAIDVRAFATAAFRTANNAEILIRRIHREFQIDVDIISGEEEARLIYEGVKKSGALQRDDNLIMDIGGGSVEFIIGSKSKMEWAVSLPLGVSLMHHQFQHSDPLSKLDTCALQIYIQKTLEPVKNMMKSRTFNTLIGASGTFDVIQEALPTTEVIDKCAVVQVKDFNTFKNEIIPLDLAARLLHPHIPESRADLIVVALILLQEVLRINPEFRFMLISPYALKEGVIAEMIEGYAL